MGVCIANQTSQTRSRVCTDLTEVWVPRLRAGASWGN